MPNLAKESFLSFPEVNKRKSQVSLGLFQQSLNPFNKITITNVVKIHSTDNIIIY